VGSLRSPEEGGLGDTLRPPAQRRL